MDKIQQGRLASVPGISVIACLAIVVVGLLFGLCAAIRFGDYAGAGACLIASALAAGLLANALWRR